MPFSSGTTYYRKARDGEAFMVSEVIDVGSGNKKNVHLKNPSDSDKRYWLMTIKVSSDGPFVARMHDAFSSAPSGGTSIDIQNVLLDNGGGNGSSTDSGTGTANKNVSFSDGSTHAVGVGGGGSGGTSVGGLVAYSPMVIEEGREVVLTVENTGSERNNYAVSLVYHETPMN